MTEKGQPKSDRERMEEIGRRLQGVEEAQKDDIRRKTSFEEKALELESEKSKTGPGVLGRLKGAVGGMIPKRKPREGDPKIRINLMPQPEAKTKKEKGAKKNKEAEAVSPEELEQEVANFISELGLEVPFGFEYLPLGHRLKIIRDLKKRVVDLVKSDAQTQYSESLKGSSMVASLGKSVTKEGILKDLEKKAFQALKQSDEGKRFLEKSLDLLTQNATPYDVRILANGKVETIYIRDVDIKNPTPEEIEKVALFNTKASEFTQMPYEWGQEKSGKNRKAYDKAKAEFEEAQYEILRIKRSRETEFTGKAMLDTLQINNEVQMAQLLNTHPEVEEALAEFSQDSSKVENFKTNSFSFLKNIIGKNATNKLLFAGGFTARGIVSGARMISGANIFTLLATSTVGAVVGGLRGKFRAKDTLEEKKKQARRGQKDESKEKARMVDVTLLINGLKKMTDQAEDATTPEERAKILSKLAVIVEHTQNQIEKGQVNFGSSESILENQFNLIKNLNRALVFRHEEKDGVLSARIDILLQDFNRGYMRKTTDGNVKLVTGNIEKIAERQRAFINKQVLKGATYGAGFATAGYALRYVGEHMGWWGNAGVQKPSAEIQKPQTDIEAGEGFIARANKMIEGAWERTKSSAESAVGSVKSLLPWGNAPTPRIEKMLEELDNITEKGQGVAGSSERGVDYLLKNIIRGINNGLTEDQIKKSFHESWSQEDIDQVIQVVKKYNITRQDINLPLEDAPANAATVPPSATIVQTPPPVEAAPAPTTTPDAPPATVAGAKDAVKQAVEQTTTVKPPALNIDAVVHKGQGVEHAFIRQIEGNPKLAQELGFKGDAGDKAALHSFAQRQAHITAMRTGYVGTEGEVRVAQADKIAYELKVVDGKVVVDEKSLDGKILETHNEGDAFEAKPDDYEYKKGTTTPPAETEAKPGATEIDPERAEVTSDGTILRSYDPSRPNWEKYYGKDSISNQEISTPSKPGRYVPEKLRTPEELRVAIEKQFESLDHHSPHGGKTFEERVGEGWEETKRLRDQALRDIDEARRDIAEGNARGADSIYRGNLHRIFPDDHGPASMENWNLYFRDRNVSKFLGKKALSNAYTEPNSSHSRLVIYLNKLQAMSNIKPKNGFLGLIGGKESAADFMKRALKVLDEKQIVGAAILRDK